MTFTAPCYTVPFAATCEASRTSDKRCQKPWPKDGSKAVLTALEQAIKDLEGAK